MPSSLHHRERVLRHQESVAELIATIRDWNSKYPIGTDVIYERALGPALCTTTRSAAQVLAGHTAVIFVEGVSGCVRLDCVRPRVPLMPVYAAREAE